MTSIKEEVFQGRRAWVLSNGLMRVSVLAGGGHIAEVRLLSDDPKKSINPMRVPHYPTIEPYEYDDAKHNGIYGSDPHRWLSSGYMGHLLCFPEYGSPSPEEAQAGLGNHGEAPIVEWHRINVEENSDGLTLRYGADLPKTQYRVERAVTLPRGMRVVRVQEWVENLTPFDRPINWMRHPTFGPPFIEPGKTVLDASATRGKAGEDGSARVRCSLVRSLSGPTVCPATENRQTCVSSSRKRIGNLCGTAARSETVRTVLHAVSPRLPGFDRLHVP